MAQVETHWLPGEASPAPVLASSGELVALVDSLRGGTLNGEQAETLWRLRTGLLALVGQNGGKSPAS